MLNLNNPIKILKTLSFCILTIPFFLQSTSTFALELGAKPELASGRVYTIELLASPQPGENAVRINIGVTGAIVQNYSLFESKNWIAVIPECTNGKEFTETAICLSLVRSEPINSNESLGFVTVRIDDAKELSFYKLSNSEYSNGVTKREDIGELLLIDQPSELTTTSSKQDTQDPLIFYALIGLTISVSIILISLIIFTLKKP